MRRFVTLAALFLCSVPFGISISGCHKATFINYCNGGDTGPELGQVATLVLNPALYGLTINEGEISQANLVNAYDCRGNGVPATFTFSSSNSSIVDVQPSTGRFCGGTWNRNTGPIPDYTYCTSNGNAGLAYMYANAGATSNPLPIYVHPIVTSVVLGLPSSNCLTDPATNCSPAAVSAASTSSTSQTACTMAANGCCTTPITATVPPYGNSCLSQGATAQLAGRIYAGTGASQSNISCQVGHLQFSPQNANTVTIDENGIATALQPGSTLVAALINEASSSAGYFSTCPPATITLAVPGTGSASPTNVIVNQNNQQVLTAVVTDTNGNQLTGLSLEYNSTSPTIFRGISAGDVAPIFPGAAAITAVCQPPLCNPAPYNEIGLNGNGTPITSNPVQVTTPGTNSTVLFIGSTQSRYIVPVDFTTNTVGSPVQLPFIPNSMVLTEDQSTLYLGSSTELMIVNAPSTTFTRGDTTISGSVLSVSPDNTVAVITDPVRKLIYLYNIATNANGTGTLLSSYGGVATSAQWSPDSQQVYIANGNQLLVFSRDTGWNPVPLATTTQNIVVTVPSVGAYLSGATTTGISYCPSTTVNGPSTGTPPTTTNIFYPVADNSAATTDQLAATNDGLHILGASLAGPTLSDLRVTLPTTNACPATITPGYFQSTDTPHPLTGIVPTGITGIFPASDSSVAFITYTGTGGVLPAYTPSATGTGSLSNVPLLINGAPAPTSVAPVAGVFSLDNTTFYAGTSGDNQVHIISKSLMKDTGVIAPKLLDNNGNLVVPNLLAQRPKAIP